MKWLLLPALLLISYYTYTYSIWALKKGYKRGGVGLLFLIAFITALTIYSVFIKPDV